MNLRSGEFIEHPGGTLPGGRRDLYVRVARPLVLALAPAAGGLYVLFLPLVAISMATYVLGRWLVRATRSLGEAVLITLPVPAWVPGRAYLLGLQSRQRIARETKVEPIEGELERLAREIEERRKSEQKE